MSVKFLKAYHRYNEGEIAGFSAQHEEWLIKRRIAERIAPAKEDNVPTKDSKPTKNPEGPQHRQTTVSSGKK